MDYNIKEVADRLRATREALDLTVEYMAEKARVSPDEYKVLESGEHDLSLSFLNSCAEALGIELLELLMGISPKLAQYTVVRSGKGLPIERCERFEYYHLAYLFKDKRMEPLMVTAPYRQEQQNKPIQLSSHEGQEYDYILSGKLKCMINGHTEILEPGDCIYYDSRYPHGMIAIDGEDCVFLAILVS